MREKFKNTIENLIIVVCWILTIHVIFNLVFSNYPTISANTLKDTSVFISKEVNSLDSISDPSKSNESIYNESLKAESTETKITLARTKDGTVDTIGIEDYILRVLAAEMPSSFELEALKAQAIAIRGIIFSRLENPSKHKDYNNADLCDSYKCCQAYKTNIQENEYKIFKQAVDETEGLIPFFNGEYAQTLYFASTVEGTMTDQEVWGNKTKSTPLYKTLNGVSPESELISNSINKYPYAKNTSTISINSFINKVNKLYPKADLTKNNIKDELKVISRTKGGYVNKVKLGNITMSGSDFRYKLVNTLKSANFEIQFSGSKINLISKGFGHGVGMSQWGANALAKTGKNYIEILDYYFNDIDIKKLY